ALAALAGGCSRVYISDLVNEKLAIAGQYDGVIPVNIRETDLKAKIAEETENWGVDIVFEASGSPRAYDGIFNYVRPGGTIVFVGLPVEPIALDIVSASAKEVKMETVFRYANVFDRALALIASGKVNLVPLITGTYDFEQSIAAFERAASANPNDVKLQITL
ncbi:MAG: zinc-binding dehydrogenase, partial [Rhizobiales bacterium]|nr:zinc-binding dehydrogenase [Hyphomicrobiales bacterium]